MRILLLLKAACLSLMLSACVAPLLLGPSSQLMWALLKPLVGFDPNEVNLLEQPIIKDRLSPLLGPHYDTTMQLLKTANELQQEGPLFYVVSRYAPLPDIAKQGGMVWNSQTNQMAVLLQNADGTTETFAEQLATQTPVWPAAMQQWQQMASPTETLNNAVNNATTAVIAAPMDTLHQVASQEVAITAEQAAQAIPDVTPQPAKMAAQAVAEVQHTMETSQSDAIEKPTAEASGAMTEEEARSTAEREMEALFE